jgi:signal transduction histidine kinase
MSLRTRLILSHLLVIGVALVLVLIIAGAYLRRYEVALERERIEDLAAPVTLAARAARAAVTGPAGGDRIEPGELTELDRLAGRLDIRVLLLDARGDVLYDTAPTGHLDGSSMPLDPGELFTAGESTPLQPQVVTLTLAEPGPLAGQEITLASAGGGELFAGIVSERDRSRWLARLTPRLMLVAFISLAGAAALATWLSDRIARPIADLTRAANAMAMGRLKQEVPGEGPDEIGQLVASFNSMSAQIAGVDQLQRRFLADAAHELRTPLTAVQGYAQALADGVVSNSEDRAKAVGVIRREADRMNRLIAQLLDLSRLESGQLELKPEPVDVARMVEEVRSRFATEAATGGVILAVSVPAGLTIVGDRERLEQMLGNLVANALRHTPAGGKVDLAGRQHQDASIVITVSDTGAGIDPQTMPHLFERFRRGPSGGFGLGLAIVREIADLHGATIGVVSQPGEGTAFEVSFPSDGRSTVAVR